MGDLARVHPSKGLFDCYGGNLIMNLILFD
jgi:hypothetical protein